MITVQKGVSCIYDNNNELIGVIHKSEKTHDNVFYSCKKMTLEQLERLLGSDVVGKGHRLSATKYVVDEDLMSRIDFKGQTSL